MTLKLLAIFAHPDDESMGMGGTLAKYSAQGVETYLVCASRGERGWCGPEEQVPGLEALGQIRERELIAAVRELDMKELHFLEYIDGEVDQADHGEIIGKIVTHIRKIQPQVIVTFPPDGNYGHPDHIAIGQIPQQLWSVQRIRVIKMPKIFPLIASRSYITWWIQRTLSTSL